MGVAIGSLLPPSWLKGPLRGRWTGWVAILAGLSLAVVCILPAPPAGKAWTNAAFAMLLISLLPAALSAKVNGSSRVLRLLPFVIGAALVIRIYSVEKGYHFGMDDGHYYSYLPTIALDHDLDLTNQYLAMGYPTSLFDVRSPIGKVKNEFPIGPALLWSPFFAAGHLVARWCGLPADGYSQPYLNAVILGNTLYCFLGLFLIFCVLRRFYSGAISMTATFTVWLTTSIFVYSTRVFLVSETVTMFAVSLFLYLLMAWSEDRGGIRPFVLGLVAALATMVRLQNAAFLVAPVVLWGYEALRNRQPRPFASRSALLLAGFVIGFIPQFLVWKHLYGGYLVNPGQYMLWWKEPRVLELLFSARKGLFTWTPSALLSLIGLCLFARKSRTWAVIFWLLFLVSLYMNAGQWDWWGSTTFGARRFTGCLLIFAAGLAALLEWLLGKKRSVVRIALVVLLLACLINLNQFLTRNYRRGRLQYDHADRFSDVLKGKLYPAYQPFIYAIQFPVQLYYHWRFGMEMYHPESEFFIGDDIIYFQERHGNLITGRRNPVFGAGWEPAEEQYGGRTVRVCRASRCTMELPMFFKYDVDLVARLSVGTADPDARGKVRFLLNDRPIKERGIRGQPRDLQLDLYRFGWMKKMNRLDFMVSPAGEEVGVQQPPALVLYSLDFSVRYYQVPPTIVQ